MSAAEELSCGVEVRTFGLTLKAFPTDGAILHVAQDRVKDTLIQFGKDELLWLQEPGGQRATAHRL